MTRVLAGLLPDVAEVQGFLALLELQTARIPSRTTGDGDPVLILDQDRRLWDRRLTTRGLEAIHRAEQLAATGSPAMSPARLVGQDQDRVPRNRHTLTVTRSRPRRSQERHPHDPR